MRAIRCWARARSRLSRPPSCRSAATPIVYRQGDGIVKQAEAVTRAIPKLGSGFRTRSRANKKARHPGLPGPAQAAREKFAAVAQAFAVDAVADALRDVPLDRNFQRGQ